MSTATSEFVGPLCSGEATVTEALNPVDNDTLMLSVIYACSEQGLDVSQEYIRSYLSHDDVLHCEDIPDLFKELGLEGDVQVKPFSEIESHLLPLILKSEDERYFVLTAIESEKCYLYFPLQDTVKRVSRQSLERNYGNHFIDCVYINDRRNQRSSSSQAIDDHWLWGVVQKHRWIFMHVLIGAVLVNLFALAAPFFSMVVFNRVLPTGAMQSLAALAIGLSIIIVFEYIVRSLRASLIESSVSRMDMQIGNQLFTKVLTLRSEGPNGIPVSSVAGIVGEYTRVRDFLTSSIVLALVDLPFTLFFVAIVAAIAGWTVAIWPLLGLFIAGVAGVLTKNKIKRISEQSSNEGARKTALLYEVLGGLETLKSCGGETWARRHWHHLQQRTVDIDAQKRMLTVRMQNTASFLRGFIHLAVIVCSVLLIINQEMTAGALIAVIMLSMRAVAPITQISGLSYSYQEAMTAKQHIDRLMESDFEGGKHKRLIRLSRIEGGISLRGVEFSYPERDIPVFKGLDIEIKPGERVAIVGKIGSGKSTLLKMMLGLCQTTSGSTFVDSFDIKGVQLKDLRKNIGYVSQELTLFSGTLRSNIVMRKPEVLEQDLIEAIQVSGLQRVMADNDTLLDQLLDGNSVGLSGGQRQTAVIARALVGRPPVMLMDEPTSLLDTVSEKAFINRFKKYLTNQTLVLVTHRHSMLALVDRVIVLDRGRVSMDVPREEFMRSIKQATSLV